MEIFDSILKLIPGMPNINLDWWHFLMFMFGLLTNPSKLAEIIVSTVNKVVPNPIKGVLLDFMNQLSKGIDKAIPDKMKEKPKK